MAISNEELRNKSQTSVRGRRLGIDANDYLVGPKENRVAVTNATSDTTGTAILNYGFHTVATTTNDVWTLVDPTPGVAVRIATATTSTGNHAIVPAAATIISSNGTAGSSIIMQGVGAHIELMGISTSQWVVSSRGGSTTAGATVVISS